MTTKHIEANIIDVPPLDVDAEPNRCLLNVERQVDEFGGRAVFGWLVQTIPASPLAEYVNHVVWESPEGELFDITPQAKGIQGDMLIAELKAIQFVPDPTAQFVNVGTEEEPLRLGRPTRFVPKTDDPKVEKLCEYLAISDRRMYSGDWVGGRYYSEKANKIAHRYNLHFDSPDVALIGKVHPEFAQVYDLLSLSV